MADGTGIEWTDATWNPITGCSVLSAGCRHCYAMRLAGTRMKHHPSREGLTIDTKAGPVWNGVTRFNEQWLYQPLAWSAPRDVFVCAHSDLFHEGNPDPWIDRVFGVMALAPQHRFQVLTKRSARMRGYLTDRSLYRRIAIEAAAALGSLPFGATLQRAERAFKFADIGATVPATLWPLPNVWMGISAEDQENFDRRAQDLQHTPAALRFFSFEPLLGPIDAARMLATRAFSWGIVGGESGHGARPMHPSWARRLRDQCLAHDVDFFFKQWGDWAPPIADEGRGFGEGQGSHGAVLLEKGWNVFPRDRRRKGELFLVGKKAAGRALDGALYDAVPA